MAALRGGGFFSCARYPCRACRGLGDRRRQRLLKHKLFERQSFKDLLTLPATFKTPSTKPGGSMLSHTPTCSLSHSQEPCAAPTLHQHPASLHLIHARHDCCLLPQSRERGGAASSASTTKEASAALLHPEPTPYPLPPISPTISPAPLPLPPPPIPSTIPPAPYPSFHTPYPVPPHPYHLTPPPRTK